VPTGTQDWNTNLLVLGDFNLERLDGPMFRALGLPLVSPLAARPTPKGSVSNRPAYTSTPVAGSSSTAITRRPPRGSTRPATWSNRRSPPTPCSKDAQRRPTRADSSSAWRSIRPRAARYTGYQKSPASGRPKNRSEPPVSAEMAKSGCEDRALIRGLCVRVPRADHVRPVGSAARAVTGRGERLPRVVATSVERPRGAGEPPLRAPERAVLRCPRRSRPH
jgi:hypothetical protein